MTGLLTTSRPSPSERFIDACIENNVGSIFYFLVCLSDHFAQGGVIDSDEQNVKRKLAAFIRVVSCQ